MGGGNGAKAAQKRERALKDAKGAGAKSQLKDNQAAMSKKCATCLQPFLVTANKKALDEHAQSKHSKTGKECFGEAYDASK